MQVAGLHRDVDGQGRAVRLLGPRGQALKVACGVALGLPAVSNEDRSLRERLPIVGVLRAPLQGEDGVALARRFDRDEEDELIIDRDVVDVVREFRLNEGRQPVLDVRRVPVRSTDYAARLGSD